jgi:hypothetical protein
MIKSMALGIPLAARVRQGAATSLRSFTLSFFLSHRGRGLTLVRGAQRGKAPLRLLFIPQEWGTEG